MNKEDVAHIYSGLLVRHKKFFKKNGILPFAAAWMGLEIIILSEVKSEREKQTPYANTYIWNLKKKVYVEPRGRKGLRTQT